MDKLICSFHIPVPVISYFDVHFRRIFILFILVIVVYVTQRHCGAQILRVALFSWVPIVVD